MVLLYYPVSIHLFPGHHVPCHHLSLHLFLYHHLPHHQLSPPFSWSQLLLKSLFILLCLCLVSIVTCVGVTASRLSTIFLPLSWFPSPSSSTIYPHYSWSELFLYVILVVLFVCLVTIVTCSGDYINTLSPSLFAPILGQDVTELKTWIYGVMQ